jgi:hypothetical protein
MPIKNNVPLWSACGIAIPKVFAMEGAVNPIDSTCMASAIQTRPKMTKRRYWNFPTPAVRMPCSTVVAKVDILFSCAVPVIYQPVCRIDRPGTVQWKTKACK